jgi:uncharacterized protein (DUF58 family)
VSVDASIPLLPRQRVTGQPHGTFRSARRGIGGDVAGSRAYVPGDDVRQIDRLASARLSLVLGRDEFVVRQQYAEESTQVVLVEDTSPSMRLFPEECPWLSKAGAVAEVRRVLAASAAKARCSFREVQAERLDAGIEILLRARLGSGSFVFLVSDFLDPPARDLLARAAERRWDVVAVVVQDPIWEQTFPDVHGVVLHVLDPATGRARPTYLKTRDCRRRRDANEARLQAILSLAGDLALDPVLLSSHAQDDVYGQLRTWADARRIDVRRRH